MWRGNGQIKPPSLMHMYFFGPHAESELLGSKPEHLDKQMSHPASHLAARAALNVDRIVRQLPTVLYISVPAWFTEMPSLSWN